MCVCRASVASTGGLQSHPNGEFLDADGHIALPGGITLLSFLDRNIEQRAHSPAYRYLDHARDDQARVVELT